MYAGNRRVAELARDPMHRKWMILLTALFMTLPDVDAFAEQKFRCGTTLLKYT